MNILLINHYAGNPKLGMEFRPYYLGREWVRSGNQVMIIGGSFSHLRKQQPSTGKETIEGIEYRWIPLKPYKGNGLGRIRSMFDFVRKLWFGYKKYLGDFRPDVVIASSTYPLDIYPARKIAKHYGARLVYEVHDLWPLSPMELGGYSKNHPFIRVIQAAEDYCYRHADKVVSLLPKALDHMVERGMDPEKFVYVPNGFDPDEWDNICDIPCEHKELIASLRNQNKFVVLYAGGHAVSNSLDTIIDAAKHLPDNDVAILLVGDGAEKGRLLKRVEKEKIKKVFFLPPVTKESVPQLLSLADVLYIGWTPNPLYRYGISPNKLVDYMVSGKPIIHSVNASNDAVADADCGISVAAGDVMGVVRAISSLKSKSTKELKAIGERGKQYAYNNWQYNKLSNRVLPPP